MKRLLSLSLLVAASLACTFGGLVTRPAPTEATAPVATQTPISNLQSPTLTSVAPESTGYCGDGYCQAPETTGKCPADCPAQAQTPPALAATLPPPPSCSQPVCYYTAISLLTLQNRSLKDNVLKLFSAAAAPQRNRLYVAGIMTSHIGILDGATEQWIGAVDSDIIGNSLKYLYLDPAANYLYVVDATNEQLRRIDLNTGGIVGPVSIPNLGPAHFAAVDTKRTRLYIASSGSPSFRAFDGHTLSEPYTNNEMGKNTGPMIYDAEADTLYILDSASQSEQRAIYYFDLDDGRIAGEIRYQAPPTARSRWLDFDPKNKRFFVGADRFVFVLDSTGAELNAFPLRDDDERQHMIYDPVSDRVVVLSIKRPTGGQIAGTGGILQAYDPGSGKLIAELTFGRKPHRMTLSLANGHIYIPNGDASVVWSIDTTTFADAASLRLGDSLEQIVVTGDGSTLFMNSRLGGGYLAAFNLNSGVLDTFESGAWPIPIRRNAAGDQLLILNAWDSALAVYAVLPEPTLLGTIPLGLPPGSTDRLPDLAVDSAHQIAYAAYPEFGQIAIADWKNMKALGLITVEGFTGGDTGGGPSQLQVAVNETADRLFAFWAREHRLTIYDTAGGYTKVRDVDLNSLNWRQISLSSDLLFFDSERDRLLVGPFELDGATGEPTGRMLAKGQIVFGLDPERNAYWAASLEGPENDQHAALIALDRDTLAVRHSEELATTTSLPPTFAINTVRDQIYVGYLPTAGLEIYVLGQLP